MPTPDASQYTQFRRYTSVSADAAGSVGSKISPFNTAYSIPMISASSQALFLPSANKEKKFAPPPSSVIQVGTDITVCQNEKEYKLYTFTPPTTGVYTISLFRVGVGSDPDLFISYPGVHINTEYVVAEDDSDETVLYYSNNDNFEDDIITETFEGGQVYEVMVLQYDPPCFRLTVTLESSVIQVGTDITVCQNEKEYKLYTFTPPTTGVYTFSLFRVGVGSDPDLFISYPGDQLDTAAIVAGEGPSSSDSALYYSDNGNDRDDIITETFEGGQVYEVMILQYELGCFRLTVTNLPAINNLVIASGGSAGDPTAVLTWDETNVTSRSISFTPSSPSVSNFASGTVTLNNNGSDITYAVTITVTNAAGSASATINVTVGCFLGFVKVMTLDGPVAVEDIVVGTKILQPTGKYSKVVELKRTTITDRVSDGDGRLYADADEKMVVTYWHKIRFSDETEEVKAGEHPRLHQVFRPTPFDVFHIKLENPVHDKVLIYDTDITAEGFVPVNPL